LTTDFVNFTGTADINTSLGITFGVHGLVDLSNPTAVSKGGQTYINLYIGDYNQQNCQKAIDNYSDPSVTKNTFITGHRGLHRLCCTNRNVCQYAPTIICTNNADCGYATTPGTCGGVTSDGDCGPLGGGLCTTSTAGACSTDNTCSANNNRKCIGGTNAMGNCNNNNDCPGNGVCGRACSAE